MEIKTISLSDGTVVPSERGGREGKLSDRREKFRRTLRKIVRFRHIYLMLLPVLVFYIVYHYVPMYGIVLAWKDWRPKYGIAGSPWMGWDNFKWVFARPELARAIRNTFIISSLKLLFCFPLPILVALVLNEITGRRFKKFVQTAMYLPHFISWVILGGFIKMLLAMDDGLVNNLIVLFGGERISFLNDPGMFYPILIFAEIWKGTGWSTIIYVAAISGIDPSLYEAAKIDGCKRGGLIFRVTLPMIAPVVTLMFIMQLSSIMNAGFDPVYNLYNKAIYETSDILDTYIYRLFMNDQRQAISAAVSIFKTVVNFFFLVGGNIVSKKISGYSMYSID